MVYGWSEPRHQRAGLCGTKNPSTKKMNFPYWADHEENGNSRLMPILLKIVTKHGEHLRRTFKTDETAAAELRRKRVLIRVSSTMCICASPVPCFRIALEFGRKKSTVETEWSRYHSIRIPISVIKWLRAVRRGGCWEQKRFPRLQGRRMVYGSRCNVVGLWYPCGRRFHLQVQQLVQSLEGVLFFRGSSWHVRSILKTTNWCWTPSLFI